jgi:ATP-dependent RNA helicase DDX5/DBP2
MARDDNHHDHKHRRKERDELDNSEHRREVKRMRTYSDAEAAAEEAANRRTRAMDKAEAEKVVGELSPEEWRKEHSITIRRHGPARNTKEFPAPFQSFTDAPFHDRLQTALTRAGFAKPTPIQAQCWPIALQQKDLISIAKTGSGKTCGFLLPAFHMHMQRNERRQGYVKPMLLVLAPTRELSCQIMEEAQKFGRAIGVRTIVSLSSCVISWSIHGYICW